MICRICHRERRYLFVKWLHISGGSRIFPRGCANSQNCYYFSNFCQKLHENERIWTPTGADPGFPIGGGANPPGGAPTNDFAKFCEKLHEIEKFLGHRGETRWARPP